MLQESKNFATVFTFTYSKAILSGTYLVVMLLYDSRTLVCLPKQKDHCKVNCIPCSCKLMPHGLQTILPASGIMESGISRSRQNKDKINETCTADKTMPFLENINQLNCYLVIFLFLNTWTKHRMKCCKPFRVQYYLSQGSHNLGIFGQVLWSSVSISTFIILSFVHAFSLCPPMLPTNMVENPLPCVLLRDKIQENFILFKLSLYITWSEKQYEKLVLCVTLHRKIVNKVKACTQHGSYTLAQF